MAIAKLEQGVLPYVQLMIMDIISMNQTKHLNIVSHYQTIPWNSNKIVLIFAFTVCNQKYHLKSTLYNDQSSNEHMIINRGQQRHCSVDSIRKNTFIPFDERLTMIGFVIE